MISCMASASKHYQLLIFHLICFFFTQQVATKIGKQIVSSLCQINQTYLRAPQHEISGALYSWRESNLNVIPLGVWDPAETNVRDLQTTLDLISRRIGPQKQFFRSLKPLRIRSRGVWNSASYSLRINFCMVKTPPPHRKLWGLPLSFSRRSF